MRDQVLTLALTKGRLLEQTLPLLESVGLGPREDIDASRRLVFESHDPSVRLLVLRGADVPVYVRRGAADLGITGKDILLEQGSDGLYEPLDLGIARCRLMTAGIPGSESPTHRVRVATKFVNVARRHFAGSGIQAEIIQLSGAMELAPMLGLADQIVDIVDTGNTLRAHGLSPLQTIAEVSARLIVNKAAMKLRHGKLRELITRLATVVGSHQATQAFGGARREDG